MVGNYLERIVVSGSRRTASALPAISGPPPMPGFLWPPLMPHVDAITQRAGDTERNVDGSTVPGNPAAPIAPQMSGVERRDVAAVRQPTPEARHAEGHETVEHEDPVLMAPSGLTGAPRLPAEIAADDDRASHPAAQQPIIRMPQALRRVPTPPPAAVFAAPATRAQAELDEGIRPARSLSEADVATPDNLPDRASLPDVTATVSTGATQPAAGSPDTDSSRVPTNMTTSSSVPARRIATAPPGNASHTALTISAAQPIARDDPAPAPLMARPPMPRPHGAETEALSTNAAPTGAATSPQIVEAVQQSAVPESHWIARLPPIPAARTKAESRITIGRVEVQVNNLSPQAPVATPSRATSAAQSSSTFLPQSYYLDRFFLRP